MSLKVNNNYISYFDVYIKNNKKPEENFSEKFDKNIIGSSDKDYKFEKDSEDDEKITSKIITNSNGVRVLYMLKGTKIFSSIKLGDNNNFEDDINKIINGEFDKFDEIDSNLAEN